MGQSHPPSHRRSFLQKKRGGNKSGPKKGSDQIPIGLFQQKKKKKKKPALVAFLVRGGEVS